MYRDPNGDKMEEKGVKMTEFNLTPDGSVHGFFRPDGSGCIYVTFTPEGCVIECPFGPIPAGGEEMESDWEREANLSLGDAMRMITKLAESEKDSDTHWNITLVFEAPREGQWSPPHHGWEWHATDMGEWNTLVWTGDEWVYRRQVGEAQ
jgi:hypothetical protein